MAELANPRICGAGSSCAAKKQQPTAAIIGAPAPSGQPVAIQIALVRTIARTTPMAESSAMPWSRWRMARAAAV
ncbi:hypothetical protein MET9862_04787 [Methylobacterium symbioticum]|uniref:Uncharacterized protein n=1 Tax=Methylobacterium symbioticum TaxID=2584084 RepID=A0A509EKZ0_9HYPH|nr:hypothetical protein MET9862_04787 [Methylobacterium symbioticum]